MKKLLSIVLSLCMLLSITAGLDLTVYAATGYEDSVITSNIKAIKKHIKENGFINGNGNYAIQNSSTYDSFEFYDLIVYDYKEDKLQLVEQVYELESDDLCGTAKVDVEFPTSLTSYVEVYFWISGGNYSDLGGHAYIDRNYNHNNDYANFYIDYNDYDVDADTAYEMFDLWLCLGFEGWDELLKSELNMNMGALGFKQYCTSHSYKEITKKATCSADGKKINACSICGKTKSTSTIAKISSVKLSATSYTYDGKAKKPTVTVKDGNGNTIASSNYTVTYSNNKNVGKASVKLTFKGNYSGTKTVYFTINPKGTSVSSVTALSKGFTVKWKKQATQTTGYQIQYATDSAFKKNCKTVTVSKNSTTSKKITKLTGKKKYYVRVRTYKTVNGTKYYSAWSKAKTVTTKK